MPSAAWAGTRVAIKHIVMDLQTSVQTTLRRRISLRGIGLHGGVKVNCSIHPAPANHGIVFVRSDLASQPKIRADIAKVVRTDMCTTLGTNGGIFVATVEHLLAALTGMGVDNALIEVDGPEVPIMDGSAGEFADAIADAGLRQLGIGRKVLRLTRPVAVRAQDKFVIATPSRRFSVKGSISFGHKVIGEQIFRYSTDHDFRKEIASARTFGFLREVEYLHKKGLALGGSLQNAIVLDETRVLNSEGLRFKNEFVRHKVLDAVGDLALFGIRLQASVELHKSGHELHAGFIHKVLEDPTCYEIIELGHEPAFAETEEAAPIVAAAHAY